MEDPKTTPSLCPAELEAFFATGVDARSAAPAPYMPGPGITPERCWIIRRCTQKWDGVTLLYEDFPTPKGLMTYSEAECELKRVDETEPGEFCAHRIGPSCNSRRCAEHVGLAAALISLPSPVTTSGFEDRSYHIAADGKHWKLTLLERGVAMRTCTYLLNEDGLAYSEAVEAGSDWIAAGRSNQRNIEGSSRRSGRTGAAGVSPEQGLAGVPETPSASEAVPQADGDGDEGSGLRCRDCGSLRHSSPKHTAACRYAFRNCPGCAYADDVHLASCPIAAQLKRADDTCCEGVDLPSLGNVHAPDCGNPRPVLRASWPLAEGVDDLFGRLLFAARDLAGHRLLEPSSLGGTPFCLECGQSVDVRVAVADRHAPSCRVGRVVDVVARIVAVAPPGFGQQALQDGGAL